MVSEYEEIVKAVTGENIDGILRRLFAFCSLGWRFILPLPTASHTHIAMQMHSEEHYFPLRLNYYSWLMNFFCMKMIWKWCAWCFPLLLRHKLCFYGNTVNIAWIIYRYIAFLSSWKLTRLCSQVWTSLVEQKWGAVVSATAGCDIANVYLIWTDK